MEIVGQMIGGVGIAVNMLTLQQKTRRALLICKLVADILWFAHYMLIGAYSGAGICVVAVFRELIFIQRRNKNGRTALSGR